MCAADRYIGVAVSTGLIVHDMLKVGEVMKQTEQAIYGVLDMLCEDMRPGDPNVTLTRPQRRPPDLTSCICNVGLRDPEFQILATKNSVIQEVK